jgi:hypothetical protein
MLTNSLAAARMPVKSNPVKTGQRILLLGTILLSGCGGGRDTSETSFRVIDAPANYVRRPLDRSETRTTTTTTTVSSDAVTPGRTVNAAPPQRRSTTVQTQPSPTGPSREPQNTTAEKSKSSPSPGPRSVANPPAQYPTAKPVPGKPGYVFSPYDPSGGYVDVNGYAPGSKVKDPYSGKIFFVP